MRAYIDKQRRLVAEYRSIVDGIEHAKNNPDLPIADRSISLAYMMAALCGKCPEAPSLISRLLSKLPISPGASSNL